MNRNEAVAALKSRADAVKARGATSPYLFGLPARDSVRADGAINLFVDYEDDFSRVDLANTKFYLEDRHHRMLRKPIEKAALHVF